MKVDLRDGLAQELAAIRDCFRFTPGNSDAEKWMLWISSAYAGLLVLLVSLGVVDYDALPEFIQDLMKALVVMLLVLFGRVNGRAHALNEKR